MSQPDLTQDQPEWPRTAGWRPSDAKYDYEYAPRLEHWFDGRSEYSYCGRIGVWGTGSGVRARRRCRLCIMAMLTDGKLRVIGVARNAW